MLYLQKKSECILVLVPLSEIVLAFCKPLFFFFFFDAASNYRLKEADGLQAGAKPETGLSNSSTTDMLLGSSWILSPWASDSESSISLAS